MDDDAERRIGDPRRESGERDWNSLVTGVVAGEVVRRGVPGVEEDGEVVVPRKNWKAVTMVEGNGGKGVTWMRSLSLSLLGACLCFRFSCLQSC